MKRLVAVTLCLLLCLLQAGCKSGETPGFLVTWRGDCQSFRYVYEENGIWHQYELFREGGLVYFVQSGESYPEDDLIALADADFLEGLDALLEDYGMLEWNGYSQIPFFEASALSFEMDIVYDRVHINAVSHTSLRPEGYERAHKALLVYLQAFARKALNAPVQDVEQISKIELFLEESVQITAQPHALVYRHMFYNRAVYAEELEPGALDAYAQRLKSLYADNCNERGSGDWAWLRVESYVGGHTLRRALFLPPEDLPPEYATARQTGFSLMGMPENYEQTQAYQDEKYTAQFAYARYYFYNKVAHGHVVVDLPGQAVTVEGVRYPVTREAMEAFYAAMDTLYKEISRENTVTELYRYHTPEEGTPMELFLQEDKEDYIWMLGRETATRPQLDLMGAAVPGEHWEDLLRAMNLVIPAGILAK